MRLRLVVLGACVAVLVATALPTFADTRFKTLAQGGVDNPRLGTPNDPDFDCAELDDEDLDVPNCSQVWSEQYNLFGFAPDSTAATALYHDPAHIAAGELSQRSGVSADRAWKITHGSPDVVIAIIDTGIEWANRDLRLQIHLNRDELPLPQGPQCTVPGAYDCNADGAFNADDYAGDPSVDPNAGAQGVAGAVDGQDLIEAFSDGTDAENNGFVDDIAGWDFFDDDNDPYDASSYSSADGHGTGRAIDAAADTDNGIGRAGICPDCQVMPLRLWDSFVAPSETYAMATLYATDNGASVQEVALGVLQNSRFARAATQYAFENGVVLMHVSSDLNTSNHNYPTNYNNTIFVAGSVADAHGLGQENEQLADGLAQFGIPVGSQVPVQTWFRNSGLTQYGGHAAIVMEGDTGSFATGQAAGAAGMIMSRGLERVQSDGAAFGGPLTSNEVKQIITLSAEDVLPENTVGTGIPDHAQPGWDQHFGYGRVDLRAAVDMVAPGTIPPEAGIESPAWFAPLDPVTSPSVPVRGFVSADRATSYTYTLEYAPGLEPLDAAFIQFASGSGNSAHNGVLGNAELPLDDIATLLPGAAQGIPPVDPYQYAFTVRLRVTDNLGNVGEDRKTLFAYHDPTMHAGWPKFVDTGGEQSLRFADLNGDGAIEIVAANTSGEIAVYNHDGTHASYFNGGVPFEAAIPPFVANHLGMPAFNAGGIEPSHGGFTTPAIGDLDGDGYPEIVAANGEQVYALKDDGSIVAGFPVSIDLPLSAPPLRTRDNHVKTGIFSSAALGDLDQDGGLDIVVAAMDQHAYAWDGEDGSLLPGWPVKLQDPSAAVPSGAESINTPAIGDIDADGFPDVIVATNEIYDGGNSGDIQDAVRNGLLNLAAGQVGHSARLYAVHHDGNNHAGGPFLTGWPVSLGSLDATLLPLVEPGVDAIVADVDLTSPGPEVINNAFAGDLVALDGAGNPRYSFQSAASGGPSLSPGTVIQSAEHSAVGDVTGAGTLSLFKGGIPVEQLVNLLAVGQNVPFQHLIQGWDAQTGAYLPGWPRAIDDYQIFSSPALADVGGAPDREVIAGSGLGLLHAFGPTGAELPSFPKLTGGWLLGVTSVGDIDGDGLLEIANATREGHMFVWDTTGPACGGNNEWWGSRHDDYNSGNYAIDSRPPRPILDLQATGPSEIGWTAPGDDFACGTSAQYEIRYSNAPINRANWASATPIANTPPVPQAGGATETFAVQAGLTGTLYFAVRAVDNAGNLAPVSNNAVLSFGSATDFDADGILNDVDNCPNVANPLQENDDPELRANGPDVPDEDGTWVNHDAIGNACDADDDNDGFLDADEISGALCSGSATNPLKLDSDGDHLTDAWECLNGSNPNSAGSKFLGGGTADADGDRVPDNWERRGYNAHVAGGNSTDSDADSCHDLVEVASVDGNRAVGDSDRLAVARRALHLWAADAVQDYALDLGKNGVVDDSDRLFVARAALLPDWQPKICP